MHAVAAILNNQFFNLVSSLKLFKIFEGIQKSVLRNILGILELTAHLEAEGEYLVFIPIHDGFHGFHGPFLELDDQMVIRHVGGDGCHVTSFRAVQG